MCVHSYVIIDLLILSKGTYNDILWNVIPNPYEDLLKQKNVLEENSEEEKESEQQIEYVEDISEELSDVEDCMYSFFL